MKKIKVGQKVIVNIRGGDFNGEIAGIEETPLARAPYTLTITTPENSRIRMIRLGVENLGKRALRKSGIKLLETNTGD